VNAKTIVSLVGGIVCLFSGLSMVPQSTFSSLEEMSLAGAITGIGGIAAGLPPLCLALFAGTIILLAAALYFRANETT
jgi:hypothetical protein